ncbi:glycosyltransferase [Algoriphagus sp. C2-6-M1]|uniref:glycosyltransferase n=1 Tax=Algoriphagus persicinus TaxID=3108754 RepID=UPI002B3C743B|nr:glycosyltransferase [Algoriphagus sp. C2-6-M1]MEB2782622.1 glycosyltransferase [Algoriphagus sp. C2-6-M1]
MNNLNILHLQFSTKSAGSCAIRLHRGFTHHSNHNSLVLSLAKDDIAIDDVTYLPVQSRILSKINNKLESFFLKYNKEKHGLFSNPILGYPINQHKLVKVADVIYVHWVMMGFMSLGSFKALISTNKRIIVFMHDMWYMTGGCHYAIDCSSFKMSCASCPVFPKNKDIALSQFIKKKDLFQKFTNVFFVSPSIWLKKLSGESSLLSNKKVHFIPNYFNSDIFRPQDKDLIRIELGLPLKKYIVCFGAVGIDSPYKGWKYLKMALEYLGNLYDSDELEVLVFGEINSEQITQNIEFKVNFLGYLDEEIAISKAYNAANVFVLPSTMDNQPTTVIESLNCGVPVVVFDLGGSPEMIDHKKNGYIARPYDSEDLAQGIHFCLSNHLNVYVKQEYHPSQVMKKHEELLNSIHDESSY